MGIVGLKNTLKISKFLFHIQINDFHFAATLKIRRNMEHRDNQIENSLL